MRATMALVFDMAPSWGQPADSPSGGIDNDGIVSDMDVSILALDGVFDIGLAAIQDTLAIANALAGARPPFRVARVGVRRRVRTGLGLDVPVARAGPRPELVIVPAISAMTPARIDEILAR